MRIRPHLSAQIAAIVRFEKREAPRRDDNDLPGKSKTDNNGKLRNWTYQWHPPATYHERQRIRCNEAEY